MILQQMHMHYTYAYTLLLDKCSGADEEAKGVASGVADSEIPMELGRGVGGEADRD